MTILSEGKVCGYPYKSVEAGLAYGKGSHERGRPRIHVHGFVKNDGTPIRFKSVKNAETYIKAMGKAIA
jgi:hypothetical protein